MSIRCNRHDSTTTTGATVQTAGRFTPPCQDTAWDDIAPPAVGWPEYDSLRAKLEYLQLPYQPAIFAVTFSSIFAATAATLR
jgi:hypothetical protein